MKKSKDQMWHCARGVALTLAGVGLPLAVVHAGGVPTLETVEVESAAEGLIGAADSANEGTVLKKQLDARTVYRPGELLETTPGLIVSQHSGEGKANQYYLRGFNLDHGTDLRTTVDGMLVNQRSHAHGQGWTDLNFLIPELASGLQYKKGPYSADEGDFASAGAVSIGYVDTLSQGITEVGVGQYGFRRALIADSPKAGEGHLLYALEVMHNDGPFTIPDNYHKLNAVARYSQGSEQNKFNVTAMAYRSGRWHATDQIPQRAVDDGAISRWDVIDPTDGGEAHRYSLSAAWQAMQGNGVTKANAYVINNKLDLFSDFTYYLDHPTQGDQFSQPDKRTTTAFNVSHAWVAELGGHEAENSVGIQFQNDNISNGLLSTYQQQTLSTTREDHIVERSTGLHGQNSTRWSEKFRTVAGVRADFYSFKVDSDRAANSGAQTASIANPKLSMIFGPWAKTEYYLNAGGGFHSNDARGANITVDPKSGLTVDSNGRAIEKTSPLVRSRGYEAGLRTAIVPGLQSTLTAYVLDFDSELVFAGDAGTTEAGRASRRTGFEWANFYTPTPWLTIDGDIAYAKARFTVPDPTDPTLGDHIPGAVEGVASLSALVDNIGPWFGSAHLRYFGPRPLEANNNVRSKSTTVVNGQAGYKITKSTKVALEVFNLFNKQSSAIDYYYNSRLLSEPNDGVGTPDIHFHPMESRSFRLALSTTF